MINWQAIEIPEDCNLVQLAQIMDEYNVVWNLDEAVAPVLRSLGTETCRKLWNDKKVFVRPYKIQYIPGKVFIIFYGRWMLRLYGLERYFPEELPPENLGELQHRLKQIIEAFDIMGIEPKKLTSPVAVYEEYLEHMSLPNDGVPDSVAMYAFMCSGKLWIEAYQIGHWNMAYDYDIKSAFPAVMKDLIDTRHLQWIKSSQYQPGATYGYTMCTADIHASINPIIHETKEGLETPIGKRRTFLTKRQIDFIRVWGIGTVDIVDGWWGMATTVKPRPIEVIIERLLRYKEHENETVRNIAKGISVGIYGKFGEVRESNFGKFFNPVWFAETSTQVTLKVAELIFTQQLQNCLIATSVDGVLTSEPIDIPGNWKRNYMGEAVVASSGLQFLNNKRPQGLSLQDIKTIIAANPDAGYYEKIIMKPVTLGEAIQSSRIEDIGKVVGKVCSLDLYLTRHDRIFDNRPINGEELLTRTYRSMARKIGKETTQNEER